MSFDIFLFPKSIATVLADIDFPARTVFFLCRLSDPKEFKPLYKGVLRMI